MKKDKTNMTICSRCHKWGDNEGYLRKNYKNTGEKRYFAICNWCNDKKKLLELNIKVQELDVEYKKKINFMLPYNI
jgi:hypothetical protein